MSEYRYTIILHPDPEEGDSQSLCQPFLDVSPKASRLKKPLLWPRTQFACMWSHCELMGRPYQKNASIHKLLLSKLLLDPGYQHLMSL